MSRVGLNVYQDKYPFYKFVERRILHRFVNVAVGNAKIVLRQLHEEGVRRHKLFLLYNGIDTARFAPRLGQRSTARKVLGLTQQHFVMTIVANLHPYKGHADLLTALRTIQTDLPENWTLLVAGRDVQNQLTVLRAEAENLGIREHVRFLGPRNDITTILAASDLHILPSHQEALPNSIIEAMASALPVIATRVGGIPELITDGKNGLLVDAYDSTGLGQAIATLAADCPRRKLMGTQNLNKVRTSFTLTQSVARYEELYSLVANHRKPQLQELDPIAS
jgi:glycosyltransferase involved in cell wall biosynthesis